MQLACIEPLPVTTPALGLGAGALLSTALTLLVTCATAIVVIKALRASRGPGQESGAVLRIVKQLQLSEMHTLYLVQAAGRYFLLGGASGCLSLLSEIDKAPVEDLLAQQQAASMTSRRWWRKP